MMVVFLESIGFINLTLLSSHGFPCVLISGIPFRPWISWLCLHKTCYRQVLLARERKIERPGTNTDTRKFHRSLV